MRVKMGNKSALFLVLLVVCYALVATVSSYEDERGRRGWEREEEGGKGGREWGREEEGGRGRREWEREGRGGGESERGGKREGGGGESERGGKREGGGGESERGGKREGGGEFLLQETEHVVRTDAGDMKVVKGYGGKYTKNPMHIGFITMEPNSLFIPQYLDSNLILFISRGEARLGYIYEDKLAEKQLNTGDVYRIPAGSAFYLVNTAEGQRLTIVCSIDTSDSIGWNTFQSFFIGGGTDPKSVLAGFDPVTMSTAFNVTIEELSGLMMRRRGGAIVYLSDPVAPSLWSKFLDLNKEQRLSQLRGVVHFERKTRDEDEQSKWSWRKLLKPLFGEENKKRKERGTTSTGPDAYNLYNRDPDFKNDYGWTMALEEDDYSPLKDSGFGVYLVNLTAGSMLAPHVNPTATEYGIVLRGSGTIEIVHPNGSLAMKAEVNQGDVFWVPRYFPFCQIASRTGPFEFFGFTTSARKNRPQFLVGADSLLQTMMGPELAAAFGVSEESLKNVSFAQREKVIFPSASASPPEVTPREEGEGGGEVTPRKEEEGGGEGTSREEEESAREVTPQEEEEAGREVMPREEEEAPREEEETGREVTPREEEEAGREVTPREEEEGGGEIPEVIRGLGSEMIMGFD